MKIQKTNPVGLYIAEHGGLEMPKQDLDLYDKSNGLCVTANYALFKHNRKAKIMRVSKNIMEACRLIDISSIRENISEINFNINSLFILLDNDESGFIKVERAGSDLSFMFVTKLGAKEHRYRIVLNSYSFVSKNFAIEKCDEPLYVQNGQYKAEYFNYEDSVFVVQLLTYLIYGDILENYLEPKKSCNNGLTRFINNSKMKITYVDTLWKQRIHVGGFKVRGHFRLQPFGENREKRKLIWIEEFDKLGYNRKATVEMVDNL